MKLLILFLEFLKIGLFTFGGGYAMIPLVEDLILKHNWMTESQFYDLIGICESTPGPIAINMATYVGASQAGLAGSIVATIGVVLPSFVIIVLIATLLKKITKNKYFQSALKGITPVIIGLIITTGITLLVNVLGPKTFNFRSFLILFILFELYKLAIVIFKKKIPAPAIIVLSGMLGIMVNL